MNSINLLPFERNRYYPGKLLTSADFLSEQTYLGNKRQFMNGLLYGPGILCGLSVYNLDDTSLMVESGAAVDGFGREVILENSVVRKVSALEGYDDTDANKLLLCLRFDEEDIRPVYAVGASDTSGGYEMNRIRESCKLFLREAESPVADATSESEFLSKAAIYEDADYAVSLTGPSVVPVGHGVKVVVTVEKLSDEDRSFAMSGVFGAPAFIGPEGEHEFKAEIEGISPQMGERVRFEYLLTSRTGEGADTMILGRPEDITISVGDDRKRVSSNIMLHLTISPEAPEDIVERELAKFSLEAQSIDRSQDYVKLAEISIERNGATAIISDVKEVGVKYYIPTIARNAQRRKYAQWFEADPGKAPVSEAAPGERPDRDTVARDPIYATGVCEIPLGVDDKKGKIHYSNEVIHGLGDGDVYVAAGCECLASDAKLDKQAKNTIYGDPTFFEDDGLPVPNAELAVRVMNERGSFIVAARLNAHTDLVVLLVRWTAVKLPRGEDRNIVAQLESDASILPVQPTVVLAPNESRFIDVRFKNMAPCALEYELTDKNSGSITVDGIYTASNKEGVYEIHIFSAENPFISTYAYAVVKRKDSEDNA
ncbi:MAG: hypothetical protein LBL63_01660 [Clostridiales Family XIII bacterium]|nr:hypothetical protein [Clostridiales Family XIII bacterium]